MTQQREKALALAEEMTRAYLSADSELAGMLRIANIIEAALRPLEEARLLCAQQAEDDGDGGYIAPKDKEYAADLIEAPLT
jgi:hypothetical protein